MRGIWERGRDSALSSEGREERAGRARNALRQHYCHVPHILYSPKKMAPSAVVTAEGLLQLRALLKRTELVNGALVVREPAGFHHGVVAMRLGLAIGGSGGCGAACRLERSSSVRSAPGPRATAPH